MKFNQPAITNPIDQLRAVGKPLDRIDGPRKTTGTAPYAYERHDVAPNQAYGYVVGATIAKGRVKSVDKSVAMAAPGVVAIVSTLDVPQTGLGMMNIAHLFGGPTVEHYHQAVAVVVAETFEQARAAGALLRIAYDEEAGRFDLTEAAASAKSVGDGESDQDDRVGRFETAFGQSPVQLDKTYTTPDETHAMMEPFASVAAWDGDKLTVWTSNQMVAWSHNSLAKILDMPKENIRVDSPFVGGGFGGKLFVRADAVLAAIAARAARRAVKVALTRPLIANNTTHRPATVQRIRLGAERDGTLTSIAHESLSGNLPDGKPEVAIMQTKLLYAAPNRLLGMKLAELDLPEGNAMRAPGEA